MGRDVGEEAVVLVSRDGKSMTLSKSAVMLSALLKAMIEEGEKMLRTLQNYQITGITGGMYVIVMFKISI